MAAVRKARGDAEGTRALIEVLLLHRSMAHEHVVAGIATALKAGTLTADALTVEARKAAQDDAATQMPTPADVLGEQPPVASLTRRRLATPTSPKTHHQTPTTGPATTGSSPSCSP
ncbi:hypothetical protein GCM10027569_31000 [Flindersiella endophytica]